MVTFWVCKTLTTLVQIYKYYNHLPLQNVNMNILVEQGLLLHPVKPTCNRKKLYLKISSAREKNSTKYIMYCVCSIQVTKPILKGKLQD